MKTWARNQGHIAAGNPQRSRLSSGRRPAEPSEVSDNLSPTLAGNRALAAAVAELIRDTELESARVDVSAPSRPIGMNSP